MNVSFGGNNGTVSGTATSSYVAVLTIPGNGGLQGKTLFQISRAGGTSIYYKILAYPSTSPSCPSIEIKAETSVTTTTVDSTSCVLPYGKVEVYIKNNVGSNTYQVDYMTY